MSIARKGLSAKLTEFLAAQKMVCDANAPGTAQLVMLRGSRVNPDGSLSAYGDPRIYTDGYDDTMVVFGQKATGAPYLSTFRASAKPGMAWIKSPEYASSGAGCPTVQPGQYPYVRGPHKGHEALRQLSGYPVCVIRDLDDDARLEASDLVDYPLYTGINIHAGGVASKVGLNSAGCQIVWGGWNGTPWTEFHKLVYRVAAKQRVFHYVVLDFSHFATWHDGGAAAGSYLLFGSSGPAVRALQMKLVTAGFFAQKLVDGVFGRGTDRAVRAWQRAQGLPPTGMVKLT